MIWLFTLLLVLGVVALFQPLTQMDRAAALGGLFLIPLALGMEFLNQWIGPFWIAQDSVYLVAVGLPVEKLVLYWVGGTFACAALGKLVEPKASNMVEREARHMRDARPAGIPARWLGIVGIGAVMAAIEFVLNAGSAFRWVRPWTVAAAFIYYAVGAFLLFRVYEALSRAKIRRSYSPFVAIALTNAIEGEPGARFVRSMQSEDADSEDLE